MAKLSVIAIVVVNDMTIRDVNVFMKVYHGENFTENSNENFMKFSFRPGNRTISITLLINVN